MKDRGPEGERGAVVIFAILLLAAGVFVLTGIAQLAATQGLSGEQEWTELRRRVTLLNNRAMAREYILSRMFRGPVPENTNQSVYSNLVFGLVFTNLQPDGGTARTNYWASLSISNTNVALNINPFNLMERGGFYREKFSCLLFDGRDLVDWSFQLRTRSPIAAGYSVVRHRPGATEVSDLATPPYIDFTKTNEQFFGVEGIPRMPLSSVTNTMTRVTGDTNGYQGFLDAPEGASVYGLFTNVTYEPREPTNEIPRTMQAIVNLRATSSAPASVLRCDITNNTASYTRGTNNYPDLPVKAVMLVGDTAYGGPVDPRPVHVVVPQSNTNVTGLVLSNDNSRLLYFYREKAANDGVLFDVSSVSAAEWRLGMTMSRCNIQFQVGDLAITGGLRTDGSISFQGGSANFQPERYPGGLDFIADRVMWLEDYRVQQ